MALYRDDSQDQQRRTLYGGGYAAPAPSPTFSQLQQQGYARPPAPSYENLPGGIIPERFGDRRFPDEPGYEHRPDILPDVPGWPPDGGEGPIQQRPPTDLPGGGGAGGGYGSIPEGLYERILELLNEPSKYRAGEAQATFERLNRRLGEGFAERRRGVEADVARRGLYYSDVPYSQTGGFRDIERYQSQAEADLAGQVAERQAQQYSEDLGRALGIGSQYAQQGFENRIREALMNQSQDQNFVEMLRQLLGMT